MVVCIAGVLASALAATWALFLWAMAVLGTADRRRWAGGLMGTNSNRVESSYYLFTIRMS